MLKGDSKGYGRWSSIYLGVLYWWKVKHMEQMLFAYLISYQDIYWWEHCNIAVPGPWLDENTRNTVIIAWERCSGALVVHRCDVLGADAMCDVCAMCYTGATRNWQCVYSVELGVNVLSVTMVTLDNTSLWSCHGSQQSAAIIRLQ